MSEERLQILRMVEAGKLSAEEAAKLLEAVDSPQPGKLKTVKVRVSEPNRKAHTIAVSVGMVDWLLQWFGTTLHFDVGGQSLDGEKLRGAISLGRPGKMFDAEEDGRRVEVWLE